MDMMDDKTLAILGDQAAAERITREGLLLECPFCHENPTTRVKIKSEYIEMSVVCFKCGISKATLVEICDTDFDKLNSGINTVIKDWNTRSNILTHKQIETLQIVDDPANLDNWEPCELCQSCNNCWFSQNNKSGGPCIKCDDYSEFSPVGFCRYCGLPLTKEAKAALEKRFRW